MSVRIELSDDEALVLFEWLKRTDEDETPAPPVDHPAERLALWAIEGALERTLVEPLRPDYPELLRAARDRLVAKGGSPP